MSVCEDWIRDISSFVVGNNSCLNFRRLNLLKSLEIHGNF